MNSKRGAEVRSPLLGRYGVFVDKINLDEHYRAFKWAVSTEWKEKNELYKSIQYKVNVLIDEYNLSVPEIIHELFTDYWVRKHYEKYDEAKGSLKNWIAHYVDLYLNHLIRKQAIRVRNEEAHHSDPLDQRNRSSLEWIDKENIRDDPDYQPEIAIDWTNPEDLLIAKEMLDFAKGHFNEIEIQHLMGEMELEEAARLSGTSCEAFRRKLDRRIAEFKMASKAIDAN